jgi:hypothetical protein
VAEAAGLAAADLERENHPQLRRLHADLLELNRRLTAEDAEPPEPDDPRRFIG